MTTIFLFLVAAWCVFAPGIAYRRGYWLGQRGKAAELLRRLREASALIEAQQALSRSLLGTLHTLLPADRKDAA